MTRPTREAWILGALVLVFVLATVRFGEEQFSAQAGALPSAYSAAPAGSRALYEVLAREGVPVGRLEAPYTRLGGDAGLLVISEPLARAVNPEEARALWRWVGRGGAALRVVSSAPGPAARDLALTGLRVVVAAGAAGDLSLREPGSPYLRDVRRLRADGPTRLQVADPTRWQALAGDPRGACVVLGHEGRGTVLVISDALAPSNRRLANADNAVLYVNAALEHSRGGRSVLFDEYHQGFGSADGGRSLWQAVGTPAHLVFWYAVVVLLVVVYNANQRFGRPTEVAIPVNRPITDYVVAMAGLYRRARAGAVALDGIYRHFLRRAAARLDADPETSPEQLAETGGRRGVWDASEVRAVLARCEEVAAGRRMSENEMLRLARQLSEYGRQAERVRDRD